MPICPFAARFAQICAELGVRVGPEVGLFVAVEDGARRIVGVTLALGFGVNVNVLDGVNVGVVANVNAGGWVGDTVGSRVIVAVTSSMAI